MHMGHAAKLRGSDSEFEFWRSWNLGGRISFESSDYVFYKNGNLQKGKLDIGVEEDQFRFSSSLLEQLCSTL